MTRDLNKHNWRVRTFSNDGVIQELVTIANWNQEEEPTPFLPRRRLESQWKWIEGIFLPIWVGFDFFSELLCCIGRVEAFAAGRFQLEVPEFCFEIRHAILAKFQKAFFSNFSVLVKDSRQFLLKFQMFCQRECPRCSTAQRLQLRWLVVDSAISIVATTGQACFSD